MSRPSHKAAVNEANNMFVDSAVEEADSMSVARSIEEANNQFGAS